MTIYFTPEWQQLIADREGYPLEHVCFNGKYGDVEYNFMMRPIEIKGEKFDYVDIVTPYAYTGPLLKAVEDTPRCRKLLAAEFDEWFQNYCIEHKIVAEYVQFCPFCKHHEDFAEIYDNTSFTPNVCIDTTKNDIFMEELDGNRRKKVRKAFKYGVQIAWDYTGEHIDDFMRLYEGTIAKYNMAAYYRFDRAFIQKLFLSLPGNVFFAYATYEGKIASINLCLSDERYVHGFLLANDPDLQFTNSCSLLMYEIACKSKQMGGQLFVMGEAGGSLMDFKKSFTRNGFYNYYVSRKIRNSEVYDMLVQKNGVTDTAFFPAYRGRHRR